MSVLAGAFVVLTVLLIWLAVAGFLRLSEPLDRLHCVTFVNAVGGIGLTLASFAFEGLSDRTGTILLVLAINLLGGAAASYATGRALRVRGSVPEVD